MHTLCVAAFLRKNNNYISCWDKCFGSNGAGLYLPEEMRFILFHSILFRSSSNKNM